MPSLMDHQDAEFRGHLSSSAMEAAPFGDVPRHGASLGRERDLPQASTSSSRNLPIRDVSESAGQKAQARDMAETSTSCPRNLPIREVSESAGQKAQARDMAETSTSSPRNLPIREVSESALQIAQAQDRNSSVADTPVWEMARTSPPKPIAWNLPTRMSERRSGRPNTPGPCKPHYVGPVKTSEGLVTSWRNSSTPTEMPRWRDVRIWPTGHHRQ
jgi:hypothetical protein